MKSFRYALQVKTSFITTTPLMIRSGFEGEFTDSSIEKTPDGKIHINGYVWSSLLRRALLRLNEGQTIASSIGKYGDDIGVSPLWTEATTINTPVTDVRPGNRIDRDLGITVKGALFSDEIAPMGLQGDLRFTLFLDNHEDTERMRPLILKALSVINTSIENIGGGWSYGFGRLQITDVSARDIDLIKSGQGYSLWDWDSKDFSSITLPDINPQDIGCEIYKLRAKILEGQLLAVHTKEPSQNEYAELPDSFVYVGHVIEDGKTNHKYIIPGRTIRQALFSVPIERKLRSEGKEVCMEAGAKKDGCNCQRCRWFGSSENGGIISVTDAVVEDADTVVLHRIQLDEHSMQNLNLFSGEYLCKGEFSFNVIVDKTKPEAEGLIAEVDRLINEMSGNNCPPGWHRLGATSTCTGQIKILNIEGLKSDE